METARPSGVSDIVNAARTQIGQTTEYDPAYVALDYPNGDIDIRKGVCTDVVIRALRKSRKMDLQQLVHDDMRANFSRYPRVWGLKRTDKNIDHRRVPNLQTYFQRRGWSLAISKNKTDYQPGDLVTCTVAGKLPHIMIVSDVNDSSGTPMVIHNIGGGAREEARLFEFPITGHYRIK
ncbi:MAG: DUF1287 domain-containing protein [Akkermansiaceae bacterium]|nr:DUF1287 domain-containing protein [Akkermansiaceae bacterium]